MPATRTYRPTTPGLRRAVRPTFEEVTKQEPEQSLLRRQLRQAGRNNRGVITVRHRGGGHKRMMRVIDFRRDNVGVPGTVQGIEYDPNRSARLALIQYRDGDKRYILAPQGLSNGDKVESGPDVELSLGNALPLRLIPLGTVVHNVELTPGKGGQMVRSAGTSAQVLAREEFYSLLRLPSGEIHRVLSACMATIGQLGNQEHKNLKLGKAGRSRHMGRRPVVRGSAMSPRDHPHGGGEGRSPIGMPGPKTPWGKPALGYKTRRNKRTSGMIVRGRRRKS